ncbi:MAG TPA: FAD-binding protein [Nocardioidaceae bacterium]|nr:FAD-binding protein [Nocardioidaceae bacterium]
MSTGGPRRAPATLAADVVVVGFGAAGACAAIEAADAGAQVLVLDRFDGGGATALSGGVVYAGGGTSVQRDAGVDDTPEAMLAYLEREVGDPEDTVHPETLRAFCHGSPAMIEWLRQQGVPFEGSLAPQKTSYPGNDHYLYYSGSEIAGAFRDVAPPAPRGHRAKAPGASGKRLFQALAGAARGRGVRVLPQTRAQRVVEHDGVVRGVEGVTLSQAPAWVRTAYRVAGRLAAKPGLYQPAVKRRCVALCDMLERAHGRPVQVLAQRGVVLCAGGFIGNRALVHEHAPAYRGGLPLGTPGDDGSGLELGRSVGGAAAKLDRVSAWRFFTPPSALLGALLVDRRGQRVIDETRYGAAVGQALIEHHDGRGWLLVDASLLAEARRQIRRQGLWFQRLQMAYLFGPGRVTGTTLEEVARRAGVDAEGLVATVQAHQEALASGGPDPSGKPAEYTRSIGTPPYSLVDISVRRQPAYPCPMLTLGGLVVDQRTGQVQRPDQEPIPGLFAAGRTAVGICSNAYVSGLSLADCVFSGRRAGRHAATGPAPGPTPGPETVPAPVEQPRQERQGRHRAHH